MAGEGVTSISSGLGGAGLVFALGLLGGEAERVCRTGEGWAGGGVAVLLKTYVSASGFGVGFHTGVGTGGRVMEMGF